MYRPRPNAAALVSASLIVLTLLACSGSAEQPILNQFFAASRLRDNTSLQNFAMVAFDPRTDGSVSSFDITAVGAEQRHPLNIKALAKVLDDAKAEDAEYSKRKLTYYNANQDAIDRALKAEREKATLKGKDADVQAAWLKFREEGTQVSRKIGEARTKLAAESAVAELSVGDQRNPVDMTKYDGELVTKEITVSASVKAADGQSKRKTLVVTMQRAMLKGDREITGRWIITSVKTS